MREKFTTNRPLSLNINKNDDKRSHDLSNCDRLNFIVQKAKIMSNWKTQLRLNFGGIESKSDFED